MFASGKRTEKRESSWEPSRGRHSEEVVARGVRGSAHCLSLGDVSSVDASAPACSLKQCAHSSTAHVKGTQTRTRQQTTTQTHHDGTVAW